MIMFESTTTTPNVGSKTAPVKGSGNHHGHGHVRGNGGNRRHRRRSARRHVNGHSRAAVVRAMTAAERYNSGQEPTLATAAVSTGSCTQYVRAVLALMQAGDSQLLNAAMQGLLPLLTAAEMVRRVRRAVIAFRKLRASEQPIFGREIGVAYLWDHVITPSL